MRVAIIVPSLVRADKLEKCLSSIEQYAGPSNVYIVNNWTHKSVESVCLEFEGERNEQKFLILRNPENLGVAGSWNAALKLAFESGHEWAIVMNDDAELLEGTVSAFSNGFDRGIDLGLSDQGMSCFAIHKRCIDAVGWFDTNFWPAYHEDEDYLHRLRIGYRRVEKVDGAKALHEQGSSTFAYSEMLRLSHQTRADQQNLHYYGRKWGGIPHYETYQRPFSDPKTAISYFPEPKTRRWGMKLDDKDRVVIDQESPLTVRLYGNFYSHGSFARVSRGLKEGLEDLGLLVGAMEVDAFDPSEMDSVPGGAATIGIYAGNPAFVGVMTSRGHHDMNFAVLAPNSTWLPERLVQSLRERAALVAPSSWGTSVLSMANVPSLPALRHGVSKAFYPEPSAEEVLRKLYDDGEFRVLHLSSTERQRKGTEELLKAWQRLVAQGLLGKRPLLICILDAPKGQYDFAENDPTIRLAGRLDATDDQMRGIYQSVHVVCQPSRGEGFGMVPLEARACGAPVVATNCTGHWDHMGERDQGCVVVRTGDYEPIDDGPGATAPSLSVEAIEDALLAAHSNWHELFKAARSCSKMVREEWSWARQTQSWLVRMGLYNGGT